MFPCGNGVRTDDRGFRVATTGFGRTAWCDRAVHTTDRTKNWQAPAGFDADFLGGDRVVARLEGAGGPRAVEHRQVGLRGSIGYDSETSSQAGMEGARTSVSP